jgi:hypothetical protein
VNQFQPVQTRPSGFDRRVRLLTTIIAGGLLLAILKPWGGAAPAGIPPFAAHSPSAAAAPSGSPPPDVGYAGRAYDASIFGQHEPEAVWSIWPAGYLVTFGFVVQVPGVAPPLPTRSPGAPAPRQTPARNGGNPPSTDPNWPSSFDLPEGNHLLLIGINTPRGFFATNVALTLLSSANHEAPVRIARQVSPWPDHFTVIGMPSESADGLLKVWPPGRYRLDLRFDPGTIQRSIEIQIAAPPVRQVAP